jgi:four helix bundle protein
MKTFRDLLVWQKAHYLIMETYRATQRFPADERFGLVQQMRRAAISVAANITEGHRRKSKLEFLKFLNVAHSSLDELQYYVILSHDLRYLHKSYADAISNLAEEVGRMLTGLKIHVQREVRHG